MSLHSNSRPATLLGLLLCIVTLIVYWQVGNHEFVSFDDRLIVLENPHVLSGLNKANIVWAFTANSNMGWHPLSTLSHLVDVQLYGLNPRGHHLTNLFFHIASTIALFLLLFRSTQTLWRSGFVAALFALHPLHVESVAWVAERRDVLSAFFGFTALLLYVEYVTGGKRKYCGWSLVAFLLGLLSKPILVTLPVIMLLLDVWPLNRYGSCGDVTRRQSRDRSLPLALIKEKLPFFSLSLVSALVTVRYSSLSELQSLYAIPFELRLANAVMAPVQYLVKMLWPTNLAVYYPFPATIPLWQVLGSLLILIMLTWAIVRFGSQRSYLVVGWCWYLVALLPVLGLIRFGSHALADRYTYLPLTGLFIIAAWGGTDLLGSTRLKATIAGSAAVIMVAVITFLTWKQLGWWRNSIKLYGHAIEVTSNNDLMYQNLGLALLEKGRLTEALAEFEKAIQISQANPHAHAALGYHYNNLGFAQDKLGMINEAIASYKKAIEIDPEIGEAYMNLGVALSKKGHYSEAIRQLQVAIKINPDDAQAHNDLGVVLSKMQLVDAAINEFETSLRLDPYAPEVKTNLLQEQNRRKLLE